MLTRTRSLLLSTCLFALASCEALQQVFPPQNAGTAYNSPYRRGPSHGAAAAGPGSMSGGQMSGGGMNGGQMSGGASPYSSTGLTPAGGNSGVAMPAVMTGSVVVNGRTLSQYELNSLAQAYGMPPIPGEWWYDARTGFFGPIGGPAIGMMHPGHSFGPLPADASHGTSGVVVNGRNLMVEEVQFLQLLAGAMIVPGRYWMDASGNLGQEGSPLPFGNLYVLAGQRMGNGGSGGGGGDNFWSSRFGAGNSTADGSAGYVSVPGYGPVSYGM